MKLILKEKKTKTLNLISTRVKVKTEMIVLVFLATVLFGFAVQFFVQRRKFYKFADKIPSPKSFGLLGHAPHFLGKDEEGSTMSCEGRRNH